MDWIQSKAPNLAVVLFLSVAVIAVVINALTLAGGDVRAGAAPFSLFYGLGCIAAAAHVAARVDTAPKFALATVTLLFILGGIAGHIAVWLTEINPYDEESVRLGQELRRAARGVLVFAAAGVICVLARPEAYTASYDSTFRERARVGMRLLVRPDAGAPFRATLGVALTCSALFLAFLPLSTGTTATVVAWAAKAAALVGVGLLGSSITIPDEPDHDPVSQAMGLASAAPAHAHRSPASVSSRLRQVSDSVSDSGPQLAVKVPGAPSVAAIRVDSKSGSGAFDRRAMTPVPAAAAADEPALDDIFLDPDDGAPADAARPVRSERTAIPASVSGAGRMSIKIATSSVSGPLPPVGPPKPPGSNG